MPRNAARGRRIVPLPVYQEFDRILEIQAGVSFDRDSRFFVPQRLIATRFRAKGYFSAVT